MSTSSPATFFSDFRLFFLKGLAVVLPSVLTIWIVVQAYKFVDEKVAEPINGVTRQVIIRAVPRVISDPENFPAWYRVSAEDIDAVNAERSAERLPRIPEAAIAAELRSRALRGWWDQHPWLDFIGLAIAVLLFYLAGRVLGGFVGRRITHRAETLLSRVPVFKQIYPFVKQVVDFLLGQHQIEFKRVAMIEYPRKGLWSIGFVTGDPGDRFDRAVDRELLTVFVPSSPTPFTGYTLVVPREHVTELDLTVEQALRFTVSGGVLVPGSELALGGPPLGPPAAVVKNGVPAPAPGRGDREDAEAEAAEAAPALGGPGEAGGDGAPGPDVPAVDDESGRRESASDSARPARPG